MSDGGYVFPSDAYHDPSKMPTSHKVDTEPASASDMAHADRLAAALHAIACTEYLCPGYRRSERHQTFYEQRAADLRAADPALICPDPEAHGLAAAVRRLTDAVAWTLRGGPDGDPTEAWNTQTGAVGEGSSVEAAITAALEADR